jgi:sRNA-binding regulator protein Hfq
MIKNRKLQKLLIQRTPVDIKTYEGEVFRGRISWWGQYELGLDLDKNASLTVLRHAVWEVSPLI